MKTAVVKGKKPAASSKIAGVDDRTLDQVVDIFKSIADRSRLLILMILAKDGETHVSAICKSLGQSQPAVSHHLTQLRSAGLVSFRREGKYNHYSVDSKLVAEILGKFFSGSAPLKVTFADVELGFKTK